MTIINYDRFKAIQYAEKWANSRNPEYYNFDKIGGDCTNFISQCIYAGTNVMNYTPTFGWYYNSANSRSPSWTGVEFLYNFLVSNKYLGPFGKVINKINLEIGDVIQLADQQYNYYHSLLVTRKSYSKIYVSSHTFDAFDRDLATYNFYQYRCIKILGARKN